MVIYKTYNLQEHNKFESHSFGFYALNGCSVIDFKEHSKRENVCEFLSEIKSRNQGKNIVVVLDNFRSHRAEATVNFAKDNGIKLVYLPPYSPDLNPIEFIWKSIKRVISEKFIIDLDHLKEIIRSRFQDFSSKISYERRWIERFLKNKLEMLGF